MSYEIEKNVPRIRITTTYPFSKMEVGDSFAFPLMDRQKVSTASSWYGKRRGMKFSIRKIDEISYRCWRIA